MPADANNAFDVAFFFSDTALSENEHLQPQKLQRLLYLAQGYYGIAHKGRKLMPAVFIADETGPIEPNIHMAFSKGRPDVDADLFLPWEVQTFLERIWRRFGHLSMEKLTEMCTENNVYKTFRKKGTRAEIPYINIIESFSSAEGTPGTTQVVKPKVMMTQSGKPVIVKAWQPGKKS